MRPVTSLAAYLAGWAKLAELRELAIARGPLFLLLATLSVTVSRRANAELGADCDPEGAAQNLSDFIAPWRLWPSNSARAPPASD